MQDRCQAVDGGGEPVWHPGGKELFFRQGDRMMSVPFDPEGDLRPAGATQRTKLPFDVAQVRIADLPVPSMNAAQSIQGKVAGVQVVQGSGRPGGSGFSLKIAGCDV